jgi:Tannase and feruloyl esterase
LGMSWSCLTCPCVSRLPVSPAHALVTYSTSAGIRRFVDYGHKIISFHGLNDPGPPVLGTIKYYEEMAQQFGGVERAQQFSRFYPVPNMGHCSGGPATDQFDLVTPLAKWGENGIPPGPIPATGVNFTPATYQVSFVQGPATRTRPLLSQAGVLYLERVGHRRCARCEQPGGFG